jgi:hypothetical protein
VNAIFTALTDKFTQMGVYITETAMRVVNLVADNFTVGSEQAPAGITLFDEDTGAPYCVKIKSAALVYLSGPCETATSTLTTVPTGVPPTDTGSGTPPIDTPPAGSATSTDTTATTTIPTAEDQNSGETTPPDEPAETPPQDVLPETQPETPVEGTPAPEPPPPETPAE